MFSEIHAMTQSHRFTAYTDGVVTHLPTGEDVTVKVNKTFRSIRPAGLRFSQYSFVTEVTAGAHVGFGYGEGDSKLVAFQKSIAEGIERAIFQSVKGTAHGTSNSNGWAAHLTEEKAFTAALDELLERDAILVHWLSGEPMWELKNDAWPNWLRSWAKTELSQGSQFKKLRVFLSHMGYVPTATTILLDDDGYAVLSHATDRDLKTAIYKALAETCRIGHMALEKTAFKSSLNLKDAWGTKPANPADHAMFYAFHSKLPSWLFGEAIDWAIATRHWQKMRGGLDMIKLSPKFHRITTGPLIVGFSTCDFTQELFFGSTVAARERGLINFDRIKNAGSQASFNLMLRKTRIIDFILCGLRQFSPECVPANLENSSGPMSTSKDASSVSLGVGTAKMV